MVSSLIAAVGLVDGANVNFTTPSAYVSGSLSVWINGRLLQAELDNGFTEGVSPAFSFKVAPRLGSYIHCAYEAA